MDGENRVLNFVKSEPVLVVSGVLALLSMFIVPPSSAYAGYINVEVLCILFCFMAVVAGIAECGIFEKFAAEAVSDASNVRRICLSLVLITYVGSMFITNDMALITFVPLAIAVLTMAGLKDLMIPLIVMQTVAANLGCMMTPFGSPHNLLLFASFDVSLSEFFVVMLPLIAVGTVLMVVMTLLIGKGEVERKPVSEPINKDRPFLGVMALMFILCIATVLELVPYWMTLIAVLVSMLLMRPELLKKVDYGLLLTFVFLFVFTGNLTHIDFINDALESLMSWDPVMTSVIASQFVSNVPATITLAGFTDDWAGLLAGVNIGGFGTPIASMASIISLKLYQKIPGSDVKRYLLVFTGANVLMLVVLLATWYL